MDELCSVDPLPRGCERLDIRRTFLILRTGTPYFDCGTVINHLGAFGLPAQRTKSTEYDVGKH